MLITVSAFSQETKLIIKSKTVENKKSWETKQVQELLRDSGWQNKIFTLDVLDCSQQTTQTIIESKNDYLITVKANQIKLYNRLKYLAKVEKQISRYQEIDQSHGRQIRRIITVFEVEKIPHKNYPHLQSFIKIDSKGVRGNKKSEETLYYISSQLLQSEIFAEKSSSLTNLWWLDLTY